jgi:monofunctional glycosyltransferase
MTRPSRSAIAGSGARRPWRPLRFIGNTLLTLVTIVAVLHAAAALALLMMRAVDPPTTALQIQRRVEALIEHRPYTKRQTQLPLSRISRDLAHAVVAAEDGGFFAHGGIDWDELKNAVDENERRRRWRGGSTITQQLVKNLFYGTRLRWLTKPLDFTLAPLADLILGKQRTLDLYLNVVEWGPGVYGAEAAARFHYGIHASQLDRERAARLAAILPAPLRRHPGAMNRYARIIMTRMEGRGW